MKKLFTLIAAAAMLAACSKDDEVSYPYTEHEIVFMGRKAGLTSLSSDQAFADGLDEVLEQFIASQPDETTELTLDGVTYDITNLQNVTGGIPKNVLDVFWGDLDEYGLSVGACYAFVHGEIPSKGGTGAAYVIYAIITSDYAPNAKYVAVKGTISPVKTER